MQERTHESDAGTAVIAIAGGLGALGRALAGRLKERGDRVIVLDNVPGDMRLPESTVDLVLADVDLNDAGSARAAFKTIEQHFGRLNGLVVVAGGFSYETVLGGSTDTWDRMYRMNLLTAVVSCQAALPLLLKQPGSHIVCIGADAVGRGRAGLAAYASSKAGVLELVKALATEVRDDGARVNAVLPSTLDTEANRLAMPDADFSKWVSLDAIGSLIMFLTSAQASQITGACIPIVNQS